MSYPVLSFVRGGHKIIFLTDTAATTWTVPNDWNSTGSTIECVGAGGQGSSIDPGGAGGGGAYSKKLNVSLTPGASVPIQVGAANGNQSGSLTGIATEEHDAVVAAGVTTTGDTLFGGSSLATALCSAQGGESGLYHGYQPAPRYGGAGGLASLGIGDLKYSGGAGGNAPSGIGTGGGGGAGGPHGAGAAGGNGDPTAGTEGAGGPNGIGGGGNGGGGGADGGAVGSDGTTDGGNGGNNRLGARHGVGVVWNSSAYAPPTAGTLGAGGGAATSTQASHQVGGVPYQGAAGGNGIVEWTQTADSATAGPGGGGGGETSFSQGAAVAHGGLYGGGGGAGNSAAGAQGIIVITYIA